jgi:hypothetical protein
VQIGLPITGKYRDPESDQYYNNSNVRTWHTRISRPTQITTMELVSYLVSEWVSQSATGESYKLILLILQPKAAKMCIISNI